MIEIDKDEKERIINGQTYVVVWEEHNVAMREHRSTQSAAHTEAIRACKERNSLYGPPNGQTYDFNYISLVFLRHIFLSMLILQILFLIRMRIIKQFLFVM
jgi:hypothetical protein